MILRMLLVLVPLMGSSACKASAPPVGAADIAPAARSSAGPPLVSGTPQSSGPASGVWSARLESSGEAAAAGPNPNHPIFFFTSGETEAQVVGGSVKGQWRAASEYPATGKYSRPEDFQSEKYGQEPAGFRNTVQVDLVRGGESYAYFGCHWGRCVPVGTATGAEATLFIPPANGETHLSVTLAHAQSAPSEHFVVGVARDWNPLPRPVSSEGNGQELSVDVDGDGIVEPIRYTGPVPPGTEVRPGGKTGKITLSLGRKGTRQRLAVLDLDDTYQKWWDYGFLDLNGDGKLELITLVIGHNQTFEIRDIGPAESQAVLHWYEGD